MYERDKSGKSAREQSNASGVEGDEAVSHEEVVGGRIAVTTSAIVAGRDVGSVLR